MLGEAPAAGAELAAADASSRGRSSPVFGGMRKGGKGKGSQGLPTLPEAGPAAGSGDPAELELLRGHGFAQVSLGPRTLRTDVAVVSLLAVAHEALAAEH